MLLNRSLKLTTKFNRMTLEDLSNKLYESKVLHDYKDGKIDYRKVHEFIVGLNEALSTPVVSGSTCFGKNTFALVEHTNNDTDEKEYGDVVGETKDYFLVKPHLRKDQNRWLKVDCKMVEYYR